MNQVLAGSSDRFRLLAAAASTALLLGCTTLGCTTKNYVRAQTATIVQFSVPSSLFSVIRFQSSWLDCSSMRL